MWMLLVSLVVSQVGAREPGEAAAAPKSTNATTTAAAKPDPLAGKSQRDICNDDALMLLQHDFDDLRFKQGFQKACCHKGALGDDDRCQLDWPSSDVPACSEVDLLRNRLFALYGYVFKDPRYQKAFAAEAWYRPRSDFTMSWLPPAAQRNVTRLKAMVQSGGCTADVDECGPAGVRWSLDLQNGSKGHVDGVQQSEMADVITARCRAGWPPGMAPCLAAGTGKECIAPLPADERKALWRELQAISPDVHE